MSFHIDATGAAFGYKPGVSHKRRFGNAKLIPSFGKAGRAGVLPVSTIARWIAEQKNWDADDAVQPTNSFSA